MNYRLFSRFPLALPSLFAAFAVSLAALPGSLGAAEVNATFSSPNTVPVTAASYTATGNTVEFALNFAPPAGTNLTVVKVTGLDFIQGTFDNLAQGQRVDLTFGGVNYPFVANYYGGTGNDLVLQWANTRVVAWGTNGNGQLGSTAGTNNKVPEAVDGTGVLAGKSLLAVASGANHSLALCSDGTLAGWGSNSHGELGNNDVSNSEFAPVAVDRTGVLAGRTVIAIAAGGDHSLALCADGALVGWGSDYSGQLGYNGEGNSMTSAPVLIPGTGVLTGKTVIAIAAGGLHSLALCADGTLAAWGDIGASGSNVPALVDRSGALAGKTVTAIAAGTAHSLVLCSDGSLVAWGGTLPGNGSTTSSMVPVLVDMTGVLAGKSIVAIAAGGYFNLVLCADGTMAAWGENSQGQLGDGWSAWSASLPVLVKPAPVLAGRLVTAISAGSRHCLVRCSDGIAGSWGAGWSGQLGNNGTDKATAPVFVNTSGLRTGERFVAVAGGNDHSIGITASPPSALVTTLAADGMTDTGVILHGSVNANGTSTSVSFQYGLTDSYGTSVVASPATVTGSAVTAASATPGGLLSGTSYHYRIVGTNSHGITFGEDQVFTTTTSASLASLTLNNGTLVPAFSSTNLGYSVFVPYETGSITVTPVCTSPSATATVNGTGVASGTASAPIPLAVGNTVVNIVVAAAGGGNSTTYTVTVTRQPMVYAFQSAATVPVTAGSFVATGNTATFALNYAPSPGTGLMVVKNTGSAFIQGTFDNLAQGQLVDLSYDGISYPFVANYYGGTGNDLVLQWANTRLLSWGTNGSGQLGNGGVAGSMPAAVDAGGALAGKTLLAVTGGGSHSFALCSDGTLAGWGSHSQIGLGSPFNETRPVAVGGGELANRTVVALDAGASHTLALCADGELVAWGSNSYGQLGRENTWNIPVLVDRTGVLAGKTITRIAAGGAHSLALCSDGTLAAWGYAGMLGNNLAVRSSVPVRVTQTGVLAGKTVVAIAAGGYHSLALCSDGTLAAWGGNGAGQLGNNSTTNALVPVLVNRSGVLVRKTITAIAAGGSHSLVLCSDGVVAAWGENGDGQLGDGAGHTDQLVPALVKQTGVLSGKTVVAVDAGGAFSVAHCSDGTLAAWGVGGSGQLGNGGTTNSNAAVLVSADGLVSGERFAGASGGGYHSLALAASPPPPAVETLAASGVGDARVTLHGTVSGNGSNATVSFEYGPTTQYGAGISGTPASVTGTTATPVTANLTGLMPGTLYHYRVVASGPGGTVRGGDQTFTTTNLTALRSLTLDSGYLLPAFSSAISNYSVTVPAGTASVTVTPTSRSGTATVTLNGVAVVSGAASEAVNLAPGNNAIQVVVAEAGQTRTYTVTVTRLPEIYAFDSPASVPVTAGGLTATGARVQFALNHAPAVGADLTVVNNTGIDFIQGAFDNLAQGQTVTLTHGGIFYRFVVNYFGGTGNDLVLQWASNRLLAWGSNGSGELGTTGTGNSSVPVPVDASGVLAGKTIISASLGAGHSMVLAADGSLAAWGGRQSYVGDGSGSWPAVTLPVLVTRTGALAGKTIAAIAAGGNVRAAACADGTLTRWGSNGSAGSYTTPELLSGGVLAGKKAVAVAAGTDHALALCADGTLVAWGVNTNGQLGDNSTTNSTEPVRVVSDGVLFDKTIIAIAAGAAHCYALCADGSVAAWGANDKGQLGDGTTVTRKTPVLVDHSGVLAGRTVVAVSAGGNSGLARCADGGLAAWGANNSGQLGDGTTVNRTTPVAVDQSGVLAGKTVTAAFIGTSHSIVRCADGTVAAWGDNGSGQFGNATTTGSNVPVLGGDATLGEGERLAACYGGGSHTLAQVAMPPPPLALTLAATGIKDQNVTLNGSVNAQGTESAMRFEYGLSTAYGTAVTIPETATGTAATPTSVTLGDLLAGATYHYRVVAENPGGVALGADLTFTTSTFASLASLSLSEGALSPVFAGELTSYSATVPFATGSLTVTPVTGYPDAAATVNGVAVASGAASTPLTLTVGNNPLTVRVASADGINTRNYTVNVVRLPESFTFASASTVPLTVGAMAAAGEIPSILLGFAPVPGTPLTLVNNTGKQPITGTFANLAQGELLTLSYGGVSYQFVANYFGGTGNDLVLHWANTRLAWWGGNTLVPTPLEMTGALAGKTVVLCGTGSHQMALTADGTLAGWGSNSHGQLGNNSTTTSSSPVLVDRSGVLAGRNVIDLVVGNFHNLALCSDGALVAWGSNNYGQLGINSTTNSLVPAAVDTAGVLAGRRITAIAAGENHCLALCADGTLAAWGYNNRGQLGNNSTGNSPVPVAVDQSGMLAGKTVVAIAAGSSHSLALCADGDLATWGYGANGQLGNGSSANSLVPVLVTRTGVLAGKTVKAIATGTNHNFALCTDGVLVCWGGNAQGALGNGGSSNAYTPVVVIPTDVLAYKTISAVYGKSIHSLAICTDGTMAAWGYNGGGQLGNNSTSSTSQPVLVSTTGLRSGERFIAGVAGVNSNMSWAITASPPPALATTTAATAVKDDAATLTAAVEPNGGSTAVTFEYGLTADYGTMVTATPSPVTGTGVKTVSYVLGGLPAGTTYHYRVVAESPGGTIRGADMTFTTGTLATLAGLTAGGEAIAPAFDLNRLAYYTTVPFSTAALTVTPTLAHSSSGVTVNGVATASGSASEPVALAPGNTTIPVVVTSGDGNNTKTYQIVVTRLPATFAWPAASTVPVTATDFLAAGDAPPLSLGHAPETGASLMVVNNTGTGPIRGTFANLAPGQQVGLEYGGITYPFIVSYAGGTGNDLVLQWGNKLLPPPPTAETLAASAVTDSGATLHASVRPNGSPTSVWFEYGYNVTYGTKVAATPSTLDGSGAIAVSCGLTTLRPGTLYHYRVAATSDGGTVVGEDQVFATSTLATLAMLAPDTGALYPEFDPRILDYALTVPSSTTSLRLRPEVASSGAAVTINGATVADGADSESIPLSFGPTVIPVVVTAADGTFSTTYHVTVTRVPEVFAFGSADDVPVSAAGFVASGQASLALGFAPEVGTALTMVDNTGRGFIRGRFENLAHGQFVELGFNGVSYRFRVDYHGGTGNDLVLQWANTRLINWGRNDRGQLGVGDSDITNPYPQPPTDRMRVLDGKTVTAVACSFETSIALCADGTLATWGLNYDGQLGNGTINQWSDVPVAVDMAGDLAGRTVIAVAAGNYHKLVLCADGTLAAWGSNVSGQLGATGTLRSTTPVLLEKLGPLAGKRIVAIDAGFYHNLVLCEDGTLATWGGNTYGQLGNGGTEQGLLPSIVGAEGVLVGREVVAISAGENHNLALCADGTLVAWGRNNSGQLGNGLFVDSPEPVIVKHEGALAGKTVVAIAAGSNTSMALCDDGSIATWGYNNSGALGNNSQTSSAVPVEVDRTGVLAGKTVVRIDGGNNMNFAYCADGTITGWGFSSYGALGTGGTNPSNTKVPVAVTTEGLASGERYVAGMTGPTAQHGFALVASPLRAGTETLAASAIGDFEATLHGNVQANGAETSVMFQFGLTTDYGTTVEATPASISGGGAAVSADLSGLLPGTSYHYRVLATSAGGTSYGEDRSFTTGDAASLASLVLSEGALAPAFGHATTFYGATVPFEVGSVTVTAEARHGGATIEIQGLLTESGVASAPIALSSGSNAIAVVVHAADGVTTHSYLVRVTRMPDSIVYRSGTEEPISAEGFTALGNAPAMSLDFAPSPGTNLMVVNNTGLGLIKGCFANLAHGQIVELPFGGITYRFATNYYGGSGNDLVLQWAHTKVFAWGTGSSGQLGNEGIGRSNLPIEVMAAGVLAGRTVLEVSTYANHALALCADGTIAAWGYNREGQLGDGTTTDAYLPVAVDRSGVLSGRQVVKVSAGYATSLALCADGTLVTWGARTGTDPKTGEPINSPVPLEMNLSGLPTGKEIVAISAAGYVLCDDGTVAAWGSNKFGKLGRDDLDEASGPVPVLHRGALSGRKVVALGGGSSCLAVCDDGSVASWGYGENGTLGNDSRESSSYPVAVDATGVLAGKQVTLVAANGHCLAVSADGTLVGWGYNRYGQVGDNTDISRKVPVAVGDPGILSGKTVVAAGAGGLNSVALCADGTLAAWGDNDFGQLGTGTTDGSRIPVAVDTSVLAQGERFVAVDCGNYFSMGIVASPPRPSATTLAATDIVDTGAVLRGRAGGNGGTAEVFFEYGTTESYGTIVAATPEVMTTGTAVVDASAAIGYLMSGTVYHYRIFSTGENGTTRGQDMTFTTGTAAALSDLVLIGGVLEPVFELFRNDYAATVPPATGQVTVTPVAARSGAAISVNGESVASGAASGSVELSPGRNTVSIVVASADGLETQSYTVVVTRLPEVFAWNSPGEVPVTVGSFDTRGMHAAFDLRHVPIPGRGLTVIENTGIRPIQGVFANLEQGQLVELAFGGISYEFVADYYGGSGNDLVLQWASTKLIGWGRNKYGQLGSVIGSDFPEPAGLVPPGVLAGKTVTSLAAGGYFSFALCPDGTLAGWGLGTIGQLGRGSNQSSAVPAEVDRSGVLADKRVVAVSAGVTRTLVLCADGTMAAWGENYRGALGDGTTVSRSVPVAVDHSGVLAGKQVVSIAAGYLHNLALCADGTLVAWGGNGSGELGDGTKTDSYVPVQVDQTGVLNGKLVVAVAAGNLHSLALCSDGTIASWGHGGDGRLGTGVSGSRSNPGWVDQSGVLAGKRVTKIVAGGHHSLALCSDGTLVAWGYNNYGVLGDGTTVHGIVPVLVDRTGVLSGKTIIDISAGLDHSVAVCADGTAAAWGRGDYGRLGDGAGTSSTVPVEVSPTAPSAGAGLVMVGSGQASYHTLGIAGLPPRPAASTLAATGVGVTGATLHARVNPNGSETRVWFEIGLTDSYGTTVAGTPELVNGNGEVNVEAPLAGVISGAIYHYRVGAVSEGGTAWGGDLTFTTSDAAALAALSLSGGTLEPAFESSRLDYLASVGHGHDSITVTPVAAGDGATIEVGGKVVGSGTASEPISLAVGGNQVAVKVTAVDGVTTQEYHIGVTRLPEVFRFDAPGDVPLTTGSFVASGLDANFVLGFVPVPGTRLTVVDNTGAKQIKGTFRNLTQGQTVTLAHGGSSYQFVANYFGGTGNDLVLHWAGTRLMDWGYQARRVPEPHFSGEVVLGGTIIDLAAANHFVALYADGSVANWGNNQYGQLGNGTTTESSIPIPVDATGVLRGRQVIAVAASLTRSFALCSDGTVAMWGGGSSGSPVPVELDTGGVLAGRNVIDLAANHALCSDGRVATWVDGTPVLVGATGVLADRKVVALAAGPNHMLALCADGAVAAWGSNRYGLLGNNSTVDSAEPVLVDSSGVLAGKTVVQVAAAQEHSLALCADGSIAAWGYNGYDRLGNPSVGNASLVPVLVDSSGVLAGKTVTGIAASDWHSRAICSDGTLVAWGDNSWGQLGEGTTDRRTMPVEVLTSNLLPGERFLTPVNAPASSRSFALTALPQWPGVSTLGADTIGNTAATLLGSVFPDGATATVSFEFGPTSAYGSSVAAAPAEVTGSSSVPVSARLTGLTPGATYHYRVRIRTAFGSFVGEDRSFTTASDATLAGLALSDGELFPSFAATTSTYAVTVPFGTDGISVTPTVSSPGAMVEVNGVPVPSGNASNAIPLAVGTNVIPVVATAPASGDAITYTLIVTRLPEAIVFESPVDVGLTAGLFTAAGDLSPVELRFAPEPGTILTVVRNTGSGMISGTFDNLPQGGTVALDHGGTTYHFVANYFGGTGRDLVLQWANTRLVGWGYNYGGQLGTGLKTQSTFPVEAGLGGALNERRVLSTAMGGGYGFSLAVCSDGTLAAWGRNSYGLGDPEITETTIPIEVEHGGALAGKTVVAVATGNSSILALCTDGTVVAWGDNGHGQLGDGSTVASRVPVEVAMTGVLAGKRVVAVGVGQYHALVLCSDGTVVKLGTTPTAVDANGVLAGRKVVAISVGWNHNLALCVDGTVVAWGSNGSGQLGNNSTLSSDVPVRVDTSGELAGKTVAAISAGNRHSLALCSDGTLVSWGGNDVGQLGNNSLVDSLVPVAVDQTGVLSGRTALAVMAGYDHNLVLCSDGSVASWGANGRGQLGNQGTASQAAPVLVNIETLRPGERLMTLPASNAAEHNVLLSGLPLPSVTSLAATGITGTGAILRGSVSAEHNVVTTAFEYGLDQSYGDTVAASPSPLSGIGSTGISAGIGGLLPGTTYHYRTLATGDGGVVRGADRTLTTLSDNAMLAALALDGGVLGPDFEKDVTAYHASVPFGTSGVSVTPVTDHFGATVSVDGTPVATGATSDLIDLEVGNNPITVFVTAEDGIHTMTYTITVTRLPEQLVLDASGEAPVTADGFTGGGVPIDLVLNYGPSPGTVITVVNNTALAFIHGAFGKLAQGQHVTLSYGGKDYHFVANYHGGTGNDLVLQWAANKVLAWGANTYGQVGDNSTSDRLLPTAIDATGVLAGKTITAVSGGYLHSLALCSDGSLAAWGYNVHGQFGSGGSAPSNVPVAVDQTGVLAGKTVVAISAGPFHNLALCADGTIAAWGYSNYGQLGDGGTETSRVPVLVEPVGALVGKHVVAVAAGTYHSFALCDDGTVAGWGYNDEGELGDGTTTGTFTPVAVDMSGALAGKRISAISAGQYHTLALCTDGTLVAWGYNHRGQLGDGSTTTSGVPVAIGSSGVLAGKTVTSIRASSAHSLALCADGTLASWGYNHRGQLGTGDASQSSVPVAVDLSDVGSGKTIADLAAGMNHGLLRFTDGTLSAWGDNANGQLGDNSNTRRATPGPVDVGLPDADSRFMMMVGSGSAANHSLAVAALPEFDVATAGLWLQGLGTGSGLSDELIRYAFGLAVGEVISGHLPQPQRIGDELVIRFAQPVGVTGVIYGAEWSATLLPGSWTAVPDTGNGGEHEFVLPMGDAAKLFMRLKVSDR